MDYVFDGIAQSDHMLSSLNIEAIDLSGGFPSQISSFNSFPTTSSFGNEWDSLGYDSFYPNEGFFDNQTFGNLMCEPSSLQGLQEINSTDFPTCFFQEYQTTDDDLLKSLVPDFPTISSQSSVTNMVDNNNFCSSNPTLVPKKGLFSQLGLDHLLSNRVGKWSDEDQLSISKRRKMDCNSTIDKSCVTEQPESAEKPSKVTKKRAKAGESTRPRPKDRQMVQDRIKELREIIPNAAKCSIDSLLDRTIKHMLFMQGVMKYDEKLKQADDFKAGRDDNNGGISGSAAWAIEVGGQNPIIVEDLGESGQMRIEMICEGRGFFLEIADVIRSFGLTILKGVVEARDEKLWAHFIVEANRNITRMQVLMSLLQLLQDTSTNPSKFKTIVDENKSSLLNNYHHQPILSLPIGLADEFM